MNIKNEIPVPQGKYIPAVRHADVIYTSGMTPRKKGKLIYAGKIKAEIPAQQYKDAIELATVNALNAALSCLEKNEKISQMLQLNVFLNTEENCTSHPQLADFASDVIIKQLGANSIGARAAIGVASLPSNATVEITLTAKIV